jgi:hypothetical protein
MPNSSEEQPSEQPKISYGDSFKLPPSEIPHLFMNPSAYIPGFESEPSALKVIRRKGEDEVTRAQWPGMRPADDTQELVNIDIKKPNFIVRALMIGKKTRDDYTVKVKRR